MKQASGRHIVEEMAEPGLEPKPSQSWPGLPPVLGLSGSLPQGHYHFPAGIAESLAATSSLPTGAKEDEPHILSPRNGG